MRVSYAWWLRLLIAMFGGFFVLAGLGALSQRPVNAILVMLTGLAMILSSSLGWLVTRLVPRLSKVPGGSSQVLGLIALLSFFGVVATSPAAPPRPTPSPTATAVARVMPTAAPTIPPSATPAPKPTTPPPPTATPRPAPPTATPVVLLDLPAVVGKDIGDLEQRVGEPYARDPIRAGTLQTLPEGGESRSYVVDWGHVEAWLSDGVVRNIIISTDSVRTGRKDLGSIDDTLKAFGFQTGVRPTSSVPNGGATWTDLNGTFVLVTAARGRVEMIQSRSRVPLTR